ncbi:MAG: UPF0262 family protein [Alphaproteobacteria bacterium]|nr:UPF0262 family protein [Alphaproteobacteria bacterium]
MAVRKNRLSEIVIDDSIVLSPSPEAEQDRQMAIHDLLEGNDFALSNGMEGPYALRLSSIDNRLVFALRSGAQEFLIGLSLSPFRRIVKDYFQICDSYNQAVHSSNPQQIEAIDMARRALHNEGSTLLQERMAGKAEMDFMTARRLFTLLCALMWRAT